MKRFLYRDDGKPLHVSQRLLAGSTAGVIAQTTIYPMEVGEPMLCSAQTSFIIAAQQQHCVSLLSLVLLLADVIAGVGRFC